MFLKPRQDICLGFVDQAYDQDSNTADIFTQQVAPIVDDVMQGYQGIYYKYISHIKQVDRFTYRNFAILVLSMVQYVVKRL